MYNIQETKLNRTIWDKLYIYAKGKKKKAITNTFDLTLKKAQMHLEATLAKTIRRQPTKHSN